MGKPKQGKYSFEEVKMEDIILFLKKGPKFKAGQRRNRLWQVIS